MDLEHFQTAYEGQPPWDIPGPQPSFAQVEEEGGITGSVLDAGCGTGENALYLAARGHEVWGIDFTPAAIDRARAKATERGLEAHFQVGDALELQRLGRTFDTAIDSGLFHTFTDEERSRYVAGLAQVVKPGGLVYILCFSDEEPPGGGPRRVTRQEILDAFSQGWEVDDIQPSRFQATDHPETRTFTPGGPRAWLARIVRKA